ncbi:hypothetical protein ES708_32898 [subsurface metagenome]
MKYLCIKCKNEKDESEFVERKDSSTGRRRWCKDCNRRYQREWMRRRRAGTEPLGFTPEAQKLYSRIWGQNLRRKAIEHYGGKCACCGETIFEFLAIDHINGGGNRHRKSIKGNFYLWLKRMNYPEGFQVLCNNCNISKGLYGYCPHEREAKSK